MNKMQKMSANLLLSYVAKNPLERLPAMLDLAEKVDRSGQHSNMIDTLRDVLNEKDGVWYGFARSLFDEVDQKSLHKLMECLVGK